MNKKIVLVGFYNEKALGVRYLANALTCAGYEPTVVFFKRFNSEIPEIATEREVELLRELIARVDPLFIGVSIMSSLYLTESNKVIDMIKKNFTAPCVGGGVYATLETERTLRKCGCDMIIRGEGEINIVKLADALANGNDWHGIDAMSYIDENDNFVSNDVGEFAQDIDVYGYPCIGGDNMYFINDDKIVEGDPQLRALSYELCASRGCPFTCSYCSAINLRRVYNGKPGKYVRFRSVNSVMEELIEAKRKMPHLRVVHFWDEVFSTEDGWVEEFARRYKAEIGIPFRIWGHPKMVDEKIISLLVDAGLHQVVMGIQSGSPYVLKEVFHRYESQETVINASRILQKCKVPVIYYDLMICHPFESVEHLKETFDLCLKLEPTFRLSIHGLNFLPATDIVQMAIDQGIYTEEQMEDLMYGTLQEQFDRHWGPHASSFKDASGKNSWADLIFLTQFPSIRKKVIALSEDAQGNAAKIAALKAKMIKRQRLGKLWYKAKLVLKISK